MDVCSKCIYCRMPKVPAKEGKKASLMIIGEAPTLIEVSKRTFFMGPAGDLLRDVMKKVGLPIEETYFTNALFCLPPKGKAIKKEGMMSCRARLLQEIREVQPRMIITLGGTALQTLMNDYSLKITQEQGSIKHCPEFPQLNVIPILHPAKILRSPGDYKIFHHIMQYASSLYAGGDVLDPGETTYTLIQDKEGVDAAIEILRTAPYVGADIEAINLNRIAAALCTRCGAIMHGTQCSNKKGCNCHVGKPAGESDILVLGVAYEKNKVLVFAPGSFPWIRRIFEYSQWIWHFGYTYDRMYCRHRDWHVRMDHELVLVHYCLNESAERGLEVLAAQYLGAKAYKSEANKYITSEGGFASAPLELQAKRVAMDADYTLQLFNRLYPQVKGHPQLNKLYHELLMPAAQFLDEEVMEYGMMVNEPHMLDLRQKYYKLIAAKVAEIQKEVGDAWDKKLYMQQTGAKSAKDVFLPTSTDQLKWLVFDRLKIIPPLRKKTPAGELSIDEDVILSLGKSKDEEVAKANLRKSYPFLADLLELRSLKKELSTYVDGALIRMDNQHRVHSTMTLHVTSTGRLSSRDPNIQNITSSKPDLRRGYRAAPGYILSEVDYSGAELRVLAHLSGIGKLGQALIDGRDLHNDLSNKIWPEKFARLLASKIAEEVQQAKNLRGMAKTVNFGIPYGREAYSLALVFGVTVQEAQMWIDTWFLMYPEAKDYLDACELEVRQGKAMYTPYGRCRRFGLITPDTVDHIINEAKNYRVQSVSSDNTLISAMHIARRIKRLDAHIINLVHDSIVIEQPDIPEVVMEVSAIAKEEMIATPIRELGCKVPFAVDIEIGPTWGDIKDIKKLPQYADYAKYMKGV